MDTILDALQEGRLFELPENDKEHALRFLAHVIEAFPETAPGTDVVELVMNREQATNTAIGKGWACPHARVPYEEDLMCVVGWSPTGIDYGAPDGNPVSLVVMHVVPENQRNHYLREVSLLAKALEGYSTFETLAELKTLDEVRNYLLDLIAQTKTAVGPDTRVKMIRLQTRPAPEPVVIQDLSNLIIEPVTLITAPGMKCVALTQNLKLSDWLESETEVIKKIETEGVFQGSGWRVLCRNSTAYPGGRAAYDCIALSLSPDNSRLKK